jgi:hypothetical protein
MERVAGLTARNRGQTESKSGTATTFRSITSGDTIIVEESQAMGSPDSQGPGGFFAALDNLASNTADRLGSLVDAAIEGRASELRGDVDQNTSRGDITDQPQGQTIEAVSKFIVDNENVLIIGGAIAAGLFLIVLSR